MVKRYLWKNVAIGSGSPMRESEEGEWVKWENYQASKTLQGIAERDRNECLCRAEKAEKQFTDLKAKLAEVERDRDNLKAEMEEAVAACVKTEKKLMDGSEPEDESDHKRMGNFIVTLRAGTDLDCFLAKLKPLGFEALDPIPMSDEELAVPLKGPSDATELLSKLDGVRQVSPSSKLDLL